MKKNSGFTLIELMVTLVIVAIFAAIAIPSYQAYIKRNNLSVAKQYMQCVSSELERFKMKNFSFKGFVLNNANTVCKTTDKYTFTLVDLATDSALNANSDTVYGLNWAMKGQSSDTSNFSLLSTSTGIRCQNKTFANISSYTDTSCGTGGESSW